MSLLERIDATGAEDEIAPGKRLIRAGDDRGVALSERLAAQLRRLAWRTPFHAFRLRGRFPLRLLAVPKDPIAGDKKAGEAILAGTIIYRSRIIATDTLDFADTSLGPDLSDYLQSFAWLRDLAAATTRERGARRAEALVQTLGGKVGMKVEFFAQSQLILIWGSNSIGSNLHFWRYAQQAKRNGAKLERVEQVGHQNSSIRYPAFPGARAGI